MVHITNLSSSRTELKPPAVVAESAQPWAPRWDTQSPAEQIVPGLCSLCCQSHPQPAGSALQGAAQTHSSTAGTLPVPCRDLGRSCSEPVAEDSRSFCIVWLSRDSVSPAEMPYHVPAAPTPARCRRDSHSLPVQHLFGLSLVQITCWLLTLKPE